MHLASSQNIDQYFYRRNRPVHNSLDKTNNSKDFKTEKSKSKAQEPKALNSNHFLLFNPKGNAKTSDKAWKEKKKY